MATQKSDAAPAVAAVERSRAGRDIIVNLYSNVPALLRPYVRDADFLPLIEDRTREFVGRSFIVDELNRHLVDKSFSSGYVVIEGEPGIGKTALAAHLVATYGWLHHFNIASANIRSSEAFLGNVCAQLATRFELDVDQLPEQSLKDSGFMVGLLNDAVRASKAPVVVVVDALDEAEPASAETGANRLLLPAVLPRSVYFVVTSREMYDNQFYAEQIRSVAIVDDDPRNLADLREFAVRFARKNEHAIDAVLKRWSVSRDELVNRLVDRSEGNFQYLRMVLAELAAEQGQLYVDMHALPRGLQNYYRRHWTVMKSHSVREYRRLQRPVLCHLAAARQPVSVDRVAEWANLEPQEVLQVLRAWRPFLNEAQTTTGEQVYSIYHRSFADFLDREEGLTAFNNRVSDVALMKRGQISGKMTI